MYSLLSNAHARKPEDSHTFPEHQKEDAADDECSSSCSSTDDALAEMLGLTSLTSVTSDVDDRSLPPSTCTLDSDVDYEALAAQYDARGIIPLPISVLRSALNRSAAAATHAKDTVKTYEAIGGRGRELTRIEKFLEFGEWRLICDKAREAASEVLKKKKKKKEEERLAVFKEKLNYKPPGGKGFAPHLDGPSLAQTGHGGEGAFVTVMVAIDEMTEANGCLEVCEGRWTAENKVLTVQVDKDGDPDREGRPGEIPSAVADGLEWTKVVCKPSQVYMFSSLLPHRSGTNRTVLQRRAAFITLCEGDFRDEYYDTMAEKRRRFEKPENLEDEWLATVPK